MPWLPLTAAPVDSPRECCKEHNNRWVGTEGLGVVMATVPEQLARVKCELTRVHALAYEQYTHSLCAPCTRCGCTVRGMVLYLFTRMWCVSCGKGVVLTGYTKPQLRYSVWSKAKIRFNLLEASIFHKLIANLAEESSEGCLGTKTRSLKSCFILGKKTTPDIFLVYQVWIRVILSFSSVWKKN